MTFGIHAERRESLGPCRPLRLHATATATVATDREWLVGLPGESVVWRHAHETAVAVRGPPAEPLRLVHRRRARRRTGTGVLGGAGLLDYWLDRVGFG
ncbi:hypothetical protein [Streptomyces sp. GC420]|uniref:hypothetical protein n=1 Tax=Streptomyces sp. GC420 TaxID=2697568 RepID=UPI001414E68A|nr:hypothetical protein [Streptomyces sp. GC420]NBM20679.1 hypothetical protein [Streptomyces sp. GC420]